MLSFGVGWVSCLRCARSVSWGQESVAFCTAVCKCQATRSLPVAGMQVLFGLADAPQALLVCCSCDSMHTY